MKGQTELMMLAIEAPLVLVFGTMVIHVIGANFNPDLQTALLNTEILRSKINEACTSDFGKEIELTKFSLPQPAPSRFGGASDFLPQFAIAGSGAGDPHYILYYEAFPPGEGIGWEVYYDFKFRAIGTVDIGEKKTTLEAFKKMMEEKRNKIIADFALQREKGEIDAEIGELDEKKILISNVVLNDYLNVIPLEKPLPQLQVGAPTPEQAITGKIIGRTDIGNAGQWIDNKFEFSDYQSLSKEEKTYIKYRLCGPNALCLKTRDAVYKFPLTDRCKGKYIQLAYDARGRNPVDSIYIALLGKGGKKAVEGVKVLRATELVKKIESGVAKTFKTVKKISSVCSKIPFVKNVCTVAKLVGIGFTVNSVALPVFEKAFEFTKYVVSFALTFKVSDFYVSSPCTLEGTEENPIIIEKLRSCNDEDASPRDEEHFTCLNMAKYPIYEYSYGDDKVSKVGEHYTCMDSIGGIESQKKNVYIFSTAQKTSIENAIKQAPDFSPLVEWYDAQKPPLELSSDGYFMVFDESAEGIIRKRLDKITLLEQYPEKEKILTKLGKSVSLIEPKNGPECVRIKVKEQKDGFCWTKNPYIPGTSPGKSLIVGSLKMTSEIALGVAEIFVPLWGVALIEGGQFIMNHFFGGSNQPSLDEMTAFASVLGFMPVKETTTYLPAADSVVLGSSRLSSGITDRVKEVLGTAYELSWVWPSR